MALPQNDAIIDAAENVRQVIEGEELVNVLREWEGLKVLPLPQMPSGIRFDCNCPTYGICMNTACPRAVRITNCTVATT